MIRVPGGLQAKHDVLAWSCRRLPQGARSRRYWNRILGTPIASPAISPRRNAGVGGGKVL